MAEEEERSGRNLIACLARHVQSPPSSCRQHQTIFRRIFFGTQHDIKTGSEQTLFVYLVTLKKALPYVQKFMIRYKLAIVQYLLLFP